MTFHGDFCQQCPTCDLNRPTPSLQPAGPAAFLQQGSSWPEAPSRHWGPPILAPPHRAGRAGGTEWRHLCCRGWGNQGHVAITGGGFVQLMVEQMGTCHRDTVGQTCCKPKSPEPLGWGLELGCGHAALPSTMVNMSCRKVGHCRYTRERAMGCEGQWPPPNPQLLEKQNEIQRFSLGNEG